MIRLLLDQGLPLTTVDFLLGAGWDVMLACQCGLATASDEAILRFALANDRVICDRRLEERNRPVWAA